MSMNFGQAFPLQNYGFVWHADVIRITHTEKKVQNWYTFTGTKKVYLFCTGLPKISEIWPI